MAKKKRKGKWEKKSNRWFYRPMKGEPIKYRFGDYFGMGMMKKEIWMYERLHDLEKKSREKGLTIREKRSFMELERWNKNEKLKMLKRGK